MEPIVFVGRRENEGVVIFFAIFCGISVQSQFVESVVAGSQESASGGDEERTVGAAANCRNFNPFLPHGERGREGHSLRGGVAVMATQTQLTMISSPPTEHFLISCDSDHVGLAAVNLHCFKVKHRWHQLWLEGNIYTCLHSHSLTNFLHFI
jgi:hypothetical protein